ncbi:MAG: hypothetical protein AWU59_2463 [Methanolobus sp. T82-4]|nr:MAG: hypothetical protein AWU59_2463 [Methanolobus sp. T82-4]
MQYVYIEYDSNFPETQLESIKNAFSEFEVDTHKRGWFRGSCLDLGVVLTVSFSFAAASYFGGMFSEAGKDTWNIISKKIVHAFKKSGRSNSTDFTFYLQEVPIHAVERFHDDNEELYLNYLPKALHKVNEYVQKFGIPEEVHMMQIFQDPFTKRWKYLFLPSPKAFGSYIDRIVDLDTFKCHKPTNHQDFIQKFCGDCNGGYCLVCAKHHLRKLLE